MNIVFVGLGGVPYSKRACDLRLQIFANAFISMGYSVTIINRFSSKFNETDMRLSSKVSVIELFDFDKSMNLGYFLLSFFREFHTIIKMNRKKKITILHLYSGHYFDLIFYFFVSRIIHAKLVYQAVEARSQIERNGCYHSINGKLCDNYSYKLFDGAICISKYLEDLIISRSTKARTVKIPPVCDISFYNNSILIPQVKYSYILYCARMGYSDVVGCIINAYKKSHLPEKNIKLVLVLSGNTKHIKKDDNIVIYKNLPYVELVQLYLGAMSLLIPLRNTIQDIARFPNKICEYTACKGIIITTNVGEIPYLFKDGVNALIANEYSESALVEQMNRVYKMDSLSMKKMKNESYQVCLNSFEMTKYNDLLSEFISSL